MLEPFVTFTWDDGREISLTGKQWDRIHNHLLLLTTAGADELERLQIEEIPLDELTPDKVRDAQLFWSPADLVKACNEAGAT